MGVAFVCLLQINSELAEGRAVAVLLYRVVAHRQGFAAIGEVEHRYHARCADISVHVLGITADGPGGGGGRRAIGEILAVHQTDAADIHAERGGADTSDAHRHHRQQHQHRQQDAKSAFQMFPSVFLLII